MARERSPSECRRAAESRASERVTGSTPGRIRMVERRRRRSPSEGIVLALGIDPGWEDG